MGQKQNVDCKVCQQDGDDITDDNEVDTFFGASAATQSDNEDSDEGFDDDFSENEISEEDIMEKLAMLLVSP